LRAPPTAFGGPPSPLFAGRDAREFPSHPPLADASGAFCRNGEKAEVAQSLSLKVRRGPLTSVSVSITWR